MTDTRPLVFASLKSADLLLQPHSLSLASTPAPEHEPHGTIPQQGALEDRIARMER